MITDEGDKKICFGTKFDLDSYKKFFVDKGYTGVEYHVVDGVCLVRLPSLPGGSRKNGIC